MGTLLLTMWHWGTCGLLVSLLQGRAAGPALPASLSVSHIKPLKAEMRSAIWMRGGKTVLAALGNAFAGSQRISPGYLQKRLCQWLWNSLQRVLNDQHNPQKYQIQFSRRKEGPKMEELLLSQIDGARATTQLLRLRTSWFKWHPAAAPAARN